MNYLAIENCFK